MGWTIGQDYIGFILSNETTVPTSGYMWCRFIPEKTATPISGSISLFTAGGAFTELAKKVDKTGIDTSSVNISTSSETQYYLGCTVSGTISGTATVVLTNCTGAITVSGTNAKVYINNCPNLTVAKAASAWGNVYIDGIARWRYDVTSAYDKTLSDINFSGATIASISIPSWDNNDIIRIRYQMQRIGWASDKQTVENYGREFQGYTMLSGNLSIDTGGSSNLRAGLLTKVTTNGIFTHEPPIASDPDLFQWNLKIRWIELERRSYNG